MGNIIDRRRQDGEEDIQVPDQPDKSEEKAAYLDGDLLDHLGELGWVRASFQGSRYYVFDGETGKDLFWLEGEMRSLVSRLADQSWMLSCTLELDSMPTMATTPTLVSMCCW